MYALFNKEKKFIGFSPDQIPNSLIKEIPKEQSDFTLWKWQGDYDTGKMILINSDVKIEEIEIDNALFRYVESKYPLKVQLINIITQLRKVVQYNDILQDDDFMDMSGAILNMVDKYKKRIKYIQKYPNLVKK